MEGEKVSVKGKEREGEIEKSSYCFDGFDGFDKSGLRV